MDISTVRKERRLTQAEMAQLIGVEQSTISRLERGQLSAPSRRLAIRIMRKTGWRHPVIADLSDEQIATLEAIEPWQSPAEQA